MYKYRVRNPVGMFQFVKTSALIFICMILDVQGADDKLGQFLDQDK